MVSWRGRRVNPAQRFAARDAGAYTTHVESCDVITIGGGVAGAASALAAARAGARVLLVRRGPGATALTGGAWTTAPPAALRDALAAAGLALHECERAVPHPDGTLVRCQVAGASHARASAVSAADGNGRTIVCGIAGLPSFHARSLAALWAEAAGRALDGIEAATLTLPGTPAAGWSPVSLAALLDREPHRLGAELARTTGKRAASLAILPAVLGLADHDRVLDDVGRSAGVVVAEALGAAPAVPGWRLDRALLRALGDAGVRVVTGRVSPATVRERSIERITVTGADGTHTLSARAFVLATGKFLGGGITAEAEFEESALGCDVAIERFTRTIDDPAAALMLTDPVRTEPQPVLSTGVRVDPDGRPLDAAGAVAAVNVFVAGSVRAGVETCALGLGAAAAEGWIAGTRAAALAGNGG
ncbi:MAG TPA: FAD-binding protein [Longimicrobiales bacterium]